VIIGTITNYICFIVLVEKLFISMLCTNVKTTRVKMK